MDLMETKRLHAMAMALDGRIKPLDRSGAMAAAWQVVLADVPAVETGAILKRIYAEPQMLVLQPGHVAQAWTEIEAERAETLRALTTIDRYLAAIGGDEADEVVIRKRVHRDRLWASLPEHVRREYESTPLAVMSNRARAIEYERRTAAGRPNAWETNPAVDAAVASRFGRMP